MKHGNDWPVLLALWALFFTVTGTALPQATSKPAPTQELERFSSALQSLIQDVGPTVVQIIATRYVLAQEGILPSASQLVKEHPRGTGVIVAKDGHVVTNAHLVERARRIRILLSPNAAGQPRLESIVPPQGQYLEAQLVGIDQETDLALVKIDHPFLKAIDFGDSDALQPGQVVVALGSPFGLANSATMGVISATGRQFRPDDPMVYVQTDAAINPGNSGGPLVNTLGQLVGINTRILSQSGGNEGLGFAAPSNIVKHVADHLRSFGRVKRGDLQVSAQTITPTLASALRLERNWGVIFSDVTPGGPADIAGIQPGDVVLTLDGKAMENGRQFDVNIYRQPIGEEVTLELVRNRQTFTRSARVRERDDERNRFYHLANPQENLIPRLGIMVLPIDDKVRASLPPQRIFGGLLVAAQAALSPLPEGAFLPGDIIYFINGEAVQSLQDLNRTLDKLEPRAAVAAHVQRGVTLQYVTFELE